MLYNTIHSLRSADVFPVVSSLPPKGGREGYTMQRIKMKYKTRQDKIRYKIRYNEIKKDNIGKIKD